MIINFKYNKNAFLYIYEVTYRILVTCLVMHQTCHLVACLIKQPTAPLWVAASGITWMHLESLGCVWSHLDASEVT